MKRSITLLSLLAVWGILGGCATSGLTASSHRTEIGLYENNYRIVATNVVGEATSEGLIGLSFGVGMGATQISLIPLTAERTLYEIAMRELWSDFEGTHGEASDRTLALVNVRYDSESLNLAVYTKLKVAVIADVVEFE